MTNYYARPSEILLPLNSKISTIILSPSLKTSETFSTLLSDILEICRSPSVPSGRPINAPKSTIFFTVPSYLSPTWYFIFSILGAFAIHSICALAPDTSLLFLPVTFTLPSTQVGLTYTFARVSGVVRIDPNDTDSISGGGTGKYLELDTLNDTVVLKCTHIGNWEIVGGYGTYSYES